MLRRAADLCCARQKRQDVTVVVGSDGLLYNGADSFEHRPFVRTLEVVHRHRVRSTFAFDDRTAAQEALNGRRIQRGGHDHQLEIVTHRLLNFA